MREEERSGGHGRVEIHYLLHIGPASTYSFHMIYSQRHIVPPPEFPGEKKEMLFSPWAEGLTCGEMGGGERDLKGV
jgi:hypothetical protein